MDSPLQTWLSDFRSASGPQAGRAGTRRAATRRPACRGVELHALTGRDGHGKNCEDLMHNALRSLLSVVSQQLRAMPQYSIPPHLR